MEKYSFTAILTKLASIEDQLADEIYEAGCEDASVHVCDGEVMVHFDRESESLNTAIRSAIAQLQAAGCTVDRVTIGKDSLAMLR